MRRRWAWVVLGLVLAGVCASAASAGMVTQRARIGAVSVAGDDALGLVVRLTFSRAAERYLTPGHVLALVLTARGRGRPAGLADALPRGRVLRAGAGGASGVIGRGNQVSFYVAGVRPSRLANVELKVLATRASNPSWRQILAAKSTARITVRPDARRLTCSQLSTLRHELSSMGPRGPSATLRRLLARRLAACAATATRPPTTTTPTTPTTTATPPPPAPPSPVGVTQTDTALSQQLAPQPSLGFSDAPPAGLPVIDVNEHAGYQQFSGLGAAMTDSAASLIYNDLSSGDRTTLMQELFGASGIHLNFLRVAMGASGAMTVDPAYSYDDMPSGQTDPDLVHFSIGHDLAYIIPTLRQALAINPGLEILANPWSPPGWMKANDSLDNKNDSGTLNSTAYQPLANYFVKVIEAYALQGVPIDAVTPQNEPRTSGSGTAYPGLTLPEPNEAQFISQDLAPALTAAGLQTKIYGNDLSWDATSYAGSLAAGPAAADLAGIAWHCYFGSPTVMSQLQLTAPALDQIVDECSPEIRAFGTPEFLISSLRNWASVVAVWGVALDPSGGPIQPGNNCGGCRGLVTIDEQSHTMSLRTSYYQLGQVSAFVQPGARRIESENFVTPGVNGSNIETVSSGLDDVAFQNPDGSKVLVAYDNSTAPISFAVQSDGHYFAYTIPAHAMTTFVWR